MSSSARVPGMPIPGLRQFQGNNCENGFTELVVFFPRPSTVNPVSSEGIHIYRKPVPSPQVRSVGTVD